jgi:cytoskeletal protein CcmA (bactofilin family)
MTMYAGSSSSPHGAGGRQSFIDSDSHFSGTHSTPNDFRVEGHFDGTIECAGTLTVAESADINARVTAGNISVAGHLQGEMLCRGRFEILSTGKVEARVQAGTIVVHEGATYQGEMRMRGEDALESGREPGPARRSESRQNRRSPSGSAEVPSFSAGGSHANGVDQETGSRANNERSPGQTIGSDN